MVDILRIDTMIFAIFADVLLLLISAQGFPHVKGIFRSAFARWIIAIVIDDPTINTIARRSGRPISMKVLSI